MEPKPRFICEPDPAHPGWHTWDMSHQDCFNAAAMGKLIVRREGERIARLRMLDTLARHRNVLGSIHGGVTLSLVDICMFAVFGTIVGGDPNNAVTLDVSCQFIGPGEIGQPLDALGEVMKETGRMVFMRGTVEQEHGLVATFLGTVRKPTRR